MNARRAAVIALLGTTLGLSLGARAWACTRQAAIVLNPTSGPSGAPVRVTGSDFNGLSPVEIRWGEDGRVVA
ncbi:MAG: hypothetical protein ACRDIU_02700, partial [Actinomycetota bacterium]